MPTPRVNKIIQKKKYTGQSGTKAGEAIAVDIKVLSCILAEAVVASAVTNGYRWDYASTLDMVAGFPIPVPGFWVECRGPMSKVLDYIGWLVLKCN